MKKILGLDLGTTSIGWAFVNEAENVNEKSSIVKLGVRIVPISSDEEADFQKGKATSINADRTLKRGARRNLDRFQERRDALIQILKENSFIHSADDFESSDKFLAENGKKSTFSTYKIRAKAAKEKISKNDFARVLLMINKKRGYKSSRKAQSDDEGIAIDGMSVAKYLYDNDSTPGQYVFDLLKKGKKLTPEFYRSDLQNEFDKIWNKQKEFYPEILTSKLKNDLFDKNKSQTWAICKEPFNIVGVKLQGKANEQKAEKYRLRNIALNEKIELEYLAIVLQEINNQKKQSSGYLGAISDRSKELYFNKQTVGEYLYNQLKLNPHARLKNQVFYRQDYLDEFETIWEKQKEFYPELTQELKREIRDVIIFYQRRLKSQKHLISECEFEKHHKVIPKSSPLFQEFKIWQNINNLKFENTKKRLRLDFNEIEGSDDFRKNIFEEANIKEKVTASEILKLLFKNSNGWETNLKNGDKGKDNGYIEGNRTNAELYKVYEEIISLEGEDISFKKLKSAKDINDTIVSKFAELGITQEILILNNDLQENLYDKQPLLQLWHLLYSFEGDNSRTGHEKLLKAIETKFGFKPEYAKLFSKVKLQADYGNLSSKAIRKILPYLQVGHTFDKACGYAGYNHSSSLTKEEQEKRELKDTLELLPKNSLRNPVVEKILNQLVNVVNAIIKDEGLGKPDEIRVELARELKKSATERAEMTSNINKATARHEKIRKILQSEFGITKVTRNDIIRYKLWEELEGNGYKTIYTNTYIPREKIFSKEFDIEHIVPKALIFDDSFSNKTLSVREVNLKKSNETAYDFLNDYLSEGKFNEFLNRAEKLWKDGRISKAKYNKLLMKASEIPDGFIERDLRNSQYIAKKATQMLSEVVRKVSATSGSITDRLRSDWQLINIMKELNYEKYDRLGLTEVIKGKNGQPEHRIRDWTKRNDHRHHAMDALTVAFTKPAYIQYLNNLHARRDENTEKHKVIFAIEQKNLHRNNKGKLVFNPPMPLNEFRTESKKHLESILISFKAKNKVVTRNKNKIKIGGKGNFKTKVELTPRGQLHKETVYGKIERYETKYVKIGTKFDLEMIKQVANQKYREALLTRLAEFEGNPKKAFGGKNAPAKNPIVIKSVGVASSNTDTTVPEKVKIVWKEHQYTIRKDISPDLKLDKVIDVGVKHILQNRLNEFNGDAKKAFVNLDENPIWINRDKGISIKRVTITGVSNAEALHYKKDHNGNYILDSNGNRQPVDFVSTGNNHHVAIYRDENGDLHDEVVSFFEAVARVNAGSPIIWKEHPKHPDWTFLFTMKQNEYFVFPSDDFDPNEIDLLNSDNAKLISPHLFRMQKFSKVEYGNSAVRDYVFRHHLETLIEDKKETKDVTYFVAKSLSRLEGIIKVRINHLGQIVKVGEY